MKIQPETHSIHVLNDEKEFFFFFSKIVCALNLIRLLKITGCRTFISQNLSKNLTN